MRPPDAATKQMEVVNPSAARLDALLIVGSNLTQMNVAGQQVKLSYAFGRFRGLTPLGGSTR